MSGPGSRLVESSGYHTWVKAPAPTGTPDAPVATGLYGGDENLHLVERFTRQPDGNLLYGFTVTDPTAWTAPWSGEYTWKASPERVFEYACHEGNYAMGNILRGARLLESEYKGKNESGGQK